MIMLLTGCKPHDYSIKTKLKEEMHSKTIKCNRFHMKGQVLASDLSII